MADPYEILGVARTVSHDDLRKAYRKAAKETHPDLNPGKPEVEARFKEISAAYDILSDAEKRKRFDAGEIDETGAEKPPERRFYRDYAEADPNGRYNQRSAYPQGSAGGPDVDYDIFADLFRGRSGDSTTFRSPPRDLRYALEINFLEAANGARKTVVMPDGKKLDISIPAGIDDQQVLRLKGQGLPGSDGKAGDAFVEITIRPHSDFKRDGTDVHTILPISLGEALNGASVRVATIDGTVDVKIPKNAKDGMKLRLRGQGVARGKTGERGDQIVEVHIVAPKDADDALANFMAEWEKTHPQYPRGKGGI